MLHKLRVLDLVRRLVDEGLTAVAAIHDLGMAARYCDRLVLLSEGRVLADGTPDQVLAPDIIERAFGVRSAVYPDPVTGSLVVSLIAPADENGSAAATGANGRDSLYHGQAAAGPATPGAATT